jgi:hypothetical protein
MVHAEDKATPQTAHLFGCTEPRICTPPLRPLTPATSLGFDVIEFATEILGLTLLPWQRSFFIRALELLPDGSLRFRTVVLLVARQNGKSLLAQVLTLYLMCVHRWPLVLGTAQDLETSEALWEEVVEMFDDDPDTGNPELAPLFHKTVRTNGKKALHLLVGPEGRKTRSVYKVKAANRRAGRGLRGNLILMDELREQQTWDAWAAITHTTLAQLQTLILCLSNAGDITSRVLRYLRIKAHELLGDPDGIVAASVGNTGAPTQFDVDGIDLGTLTAKDEVDQLLLVDDIEADPLTVEELTVNATTVGFFEWSAPPGCKLRDRDGWRHANPSMGYTDLTARAIASSSHTEPEPVFRTEVLCQWLDGVTAGPWSPGSWEATAVTLVAGPDGVEVLDDSDRIVGPVVAGIASSADREFKFTFIALAGRRADGRAQVELAVGRYGDDWVRPWLTSPDRKGRITAVTGQLKGSPESTLIRSLAGDPSFTALIPVMPLSGQDLLDAHAQAYDALRFGQVWHRPQPMLDIAAATALRKLLGAGAWVLDRVKSPVDVAPLAAFVAALWLLSTPTPEAPPPPPPPVAVRRDTLGLGERGEQTDLTSDLASLGF